MVKNFHMPTRIFLSFSTMFLLSSCAIDNLSIQSKNEANAFESVSFDLLSSGSKVNQSDILYSWNFGDDTTETSKNPTHIYGKPGTYNVTLTVSMKGQSETKQIQKQITIKPLVASKYSAVAVKVTDGSMGLQQGVINRSLKNVKVRINGEEVTTNDFGFANFPKVDNSNKTLVEAETDGFIKQTIQLEPSQLNTARGLEIVLRKREPAVEIPDIAQANTINIPAISSFGDQLGNVTITYDKGAFVNSKGLPVSGQTTFEVTPWFANDAFSSLAFLGNGVAIDSQGKYTQLQSFGAMTVDIKQNGEKLQLLPGRTAEITMPLTLLKDYSGIPLTPGYKIPMWYFSENTGAWIEDGIGEVFKDIDGTMKVKARVSHFTTWNWDMKFENPNSSFVKCKLNDGTAIPCELRASLKFPNSGNVMSKVISIGTEGTQIVNIDPQALVTLTGIYYDTVNNKYYRGNAFINGLDNSIPSNIDLTLTSFEGLIYDKLIDFKVSNSFLLLSNNNYSLSPSVQIAIQKNLVGIKYTDLQGNSRWLEDGEYKLQELPKNINLPATTITLPSSSNPPVNAIPIDSPVTTISPPIGSKNYELLLYSDTAKLKGNFEVYYSLAAWSSDGWIGCDTCHSSFNIMR